MTSPASSSPLRITWVLPFLQFTGGVRVVYEHTRQLERLGHEVTIVVPAPRPVPWTAPGRRALSTWLLERLVLRSDRMLRFYGLASRVRRVESLRASALPAADVTIATAWSTAGVVAEAPPRCGRGAYFLQHYEAFEPGLVESVDATWRLPLARIVIASWLARLGRERFGVATWGPVVNGVDLEVFHDRGRVDHEPPVVGMMYETIPWKGTADGMAAIERVRSEVPGVRLHLFGRPRLRHRLAPEDRYERNPAPERLPAIYRECDIFVSPSWSEGCALPPMEAMASRCAVVATESGGIPDYAVLGKTVLTSPPRDRNALASSLATVVRDPERRRDLARAGRDHIARFGWPTKSAELELVLRRIVAGDSP